MKPVFSVCVLTLDNFLFQSSVTMDLENRGIAGLFLPENSHVPLDRPGTKKLVSNIQELSRFEDPFINLAGLSVQTKRLYLGTSVSLLTHRDPILLARSVWSLQRLSKNRLIMGIAGGFIKEAMENFGVKFEDRWNTVRDSIIIMRSIWSQEMSRSDSTAIVKIPPIWIGSNSRAVPDRVAEYANGWLVRKNLYRGDPFADLKVACDHWQRDMDEITMVSMDTSRDKITIEHDLKAGYKHFIFFISFQCSSEYYRSLDVITSIVEEF